MARNNQSTFFSQGQKITTGNYNALLLASQTFMPHTFYDTELHSFTYSRTFDWVLFTDYNVKCLTQQIRRNQVIMWCSIFTVVFSSTFTQRNITNSNTYVSAVLCKIPKSKRALGFNQFLLCVLRGKGLQAAQEYEINKMIQSQS